MCILNVTGGFKTCPDSKIRMCVSEDKSQLRTMTRPTGQHRMLDSFVLSSAAAKRLMLTGLHLQISCPYMGRRV
jgi:hypothetical protein